MVDLASIRLVFDNKRVGRSYLIQRKTPRLRRSYLSAKMFLPMELVVFLGAWFLASILLRWLNGLGKAGRRYPPSLPSLPLVGSLPFLRDFNNFADFFMRKADELGPIFTFRAGSKLVLILNSRKAIEDALVNHSTEFSGRSLLYTETFVNPNGKGLTMMNATQEWKRYNKLSLTILRNLGLGVKNVMEARILTELELLTEHILKFNGRAFNPKELVYISGSNIISNILFGYRQDFDHGMTELGRLIKQMFDSFDANLDVAHILRFLPFHRKKLLLNFETEEMLQKTFRNEIERIRKDNSSDCFVSRYLEHEGPGCDTEQLIFTLRDILAAATDTSANIITWTMIALANSPDIQDRLREEIDGAIPRERLPSVMDQKNMPFVEAITLEILRWRTLVPLALPHMTITDTSVGDYFVPAGTKVLVNIYAAHMNPKIWKDPETFRPDRFLDKDGRIINKESVIAFSLGRRACVGESMARAEYFLLLTGLVQRFIIRPPEGQKSVDAKAIEPLALILTTTEFDIRLIPRE